VARSRPPRSSAAAAAVLLAFGFLLATGLVQERLREEQLPRSTAELIALIRARRSTVQDLAAQVQELSGQIDQLQGSAAQGSTRLQELLRRLDALRAGAGLEAVEGPGVVVELTDSPRAATSAAETDLRIQDVDLRLVVNALWRAGAEAVAINGQRVVATTAIRRAGDAVLVNYRAVQSPYRVVALGDPVGLEEGLETSGVTGQFEVWREVYGLGFEVARADDLRVPAVVALPEVRWSDVGDGP
jgi:uncharacterized protein YlxW (UPF0749 family)